MNDYLVLISGKTTTGKSTSFMNVENPEGVMYLNTEAGKKLPFKSKFKEFTLTDPLQIFEAFDEAEKLPDVHTIIVDSLTYLLDMYESEYVLTAADTRKAWGDFAQFFKKLMQSYVAKSTKNVIFTGHTLDTYNEKEMNVETKVPVKGALKNNGIESYFSIVISTKRMPISKLEEYQSDLLNITDQEKTLGFKYVFQTMITKDTVNERIRGPLGLFSTNETYIDNDIQLVINRLKEYYN